MNDESITKPCSCCGEVKPLCEFNSDKTKKLGVTSRCKICARRATRQWEIENKDRKNANSRRWAANNPEKRAEISRRYVAKLGREEKRRQLNEWRSKNPEANRAALAKRRKQLQERGPGYSAADVRQIFALQRGTCAICRCKLPASYHVDHITPLARGGRNEKTNLQLLCPPCNLRKSARDPLEFMQANGFLL